MSLLFQIANGLGSVRAQLQSEGDSIDGIQNLSDATNTVYVPNYLGCLITLNHTSQNGVNFRIYEQAGRALIKNEGTGLKIVNGTSGLEIQFNQLGYALPGIVGTVLGKASNEAGLKDLIKQNSGLSNLRVALFGLIDRVTGQLSEL